MGSTWNVRSVPSAVADGLKPQLEFAQLEFDREFLSPASWAGVPRGRDPRVTLVPTNWDSLTRGYYLLSLRDSLMQPTTLMACNRLFLLNQSAMSGTGSTGDA
jgi:hypothetical protein